MRWDGRRWTSRPLHFPLPSLHSSLPTVFVHSLEELIQLLPGEALREAKGRGGGGRWIEERKRRDMKVKIDKENEGRG
jgi:hypothetical protein